MAAAAPSAASGRCRAGAPRGRAAAPRCPTAARCARRSTGSGEASASASGGLRASAHQRHQQAAALRLVLLQFGAVSRAASAVERFRPGPPASTTPPRGAASPRRRRRFAARRPSISAGSAAAVLRQRVALGAALRGALLDGVDLFAPGVGAPRNRDRARRHAGGAEKKRRVSRGTRIRGVKQRVAGHRRRLLQAHQRQQGRRDIGEPAIVELGRRPAGR